MVPQSNVITARGLWIIRGSVRGERRGFELSVTHRLVSYICSRVGLRCYAHFLRCAAADPYAPHLLVLQTPQMPTRAMAPQGYVQPQMSVAPHGMRHPCPSAPSSTPHQQPPQQHLLPQPLHHLPHPLYICMSRQPSMHNCAFSYRYFNCCDAGS